MIPIPMFGELPLLTSHDLLLSSPFQAPLDVNKFVLKARSLVWSYKSPGHFWDLKPSICLGIWFF